MRILLVEDDELSRLVLRRVLRGLGHTCVCAEDGAQALRCIEAESFEAILLDLLMPGIDGIETARRMQNLGVTAPLILLTAMDNAQTKQHAKEAGIHRLLAKPVNKSELAEALAQVMVRPPAGQKKSAHNTEALPLNNTSALSLLLLRERSFGDDALAAEMLELFRQDGPTRLSELMAALRNGDLELATQKAHALKGICASVTARRAAAAAVELEAALSERDLPAAHQLLPPLSDALEHAVSDIDNVLAEL